MMQSLFAGVSGLRSHQRRMDVIGNNVANVNTVGFKAARATFQDVLYNTLRGAGAPQNNRGGTNPMQVGLGVQVGSIDTLFTSGNPQSTGVETDLMIQGEGLFVVTDGERRYFTRAGNFYPDSNGTLVTPGGYKVLGWTADAEGNIDPLAPLGELKIEEGSVIDATATTSVVLSRDLDAQTAVGDRVRTPAKVTYDSLGTPREISGEFERLEATYSWSVVVRVDGQEARTSDPGDIVFGSSGTLADVSDSVKSYTVTLNNGADPLEFSVDFSRLTQYSGQSTDQDGNTVTIASQDGFPSGTLERFAFDSNGVITGYYSNGLRRALGQ